MAQTHKILAQAFPSSGVLADMYIVPDNTQAICSTLAVCNQGASSFYNIAVRPTGEALESKHYIAYNASINNYDTTFLTIGISLNSGDYLSVMAYNSGVSFTLFGVEIT